MKLQHNEAKKNVMNQQKNGVQKAEKQTNTHTRIYRKRSIKTLWVMQSGQSELHVLKVVCVLEFEAIFFIQLQSQQQQQKLSI